MKLVNTTPIETQRYLINIPYLLVSLTMVMKTFKMVENLATYICIYILTYHC